MPVHCPGADLHGGSYSISRQVALLSGPEAPDHAMPDMQAKVQLL